MCERILGGGNRLLHPSLSFSLSPSLSSLSLSLSLRLGGGRPVAGISVAEDRMNRHCNDVQTLQSELTENFSKTKQLPLRICWSVVVPRDLPIN